MSGRPHSLLVEHFLHPHPETFGRLINGYAPRGCLACEEIGLRCWCGGTVGPRWPGDTHGLGCLENVNHDWQSLTPPEPQMSHTYTVPDDPKMLRETLCVLEAAFNHSDFAMDSRAPHHRARISRLIAECDRKRPVGPDGKHGERHTSECGCDV